MKLIVAQLGARMNYAVPRILHSAGRLEKLYTDLCAVAGWPRWLRLVPEALRTSGIKRILGRVPQGIPRQNITPFQQLGWHYARQRAKATNASELTRSFLWANQNFAESVCRQDWGAAAGVFTFNNAGLEILKRARERGLTTVMEQTIAPRRIEEQLLAEERRAFPGWEDVVEDRYLEEYCAREEAEWLDADRIVCGSEFVRESVAACGGPRERCVVVPYGIDAPAEAETSWLKKISMTDNSADEKKRPLRVLTVGAVGLRKGSQYVMQAAQALWGRAQFRMVGGIGVRPGPLAELKSHVEVTGPVSRNELWAHYAWADVFLLPSICEGSATVTYDALACGLPVIATPNTGTVIRDTMEGFIVPIRDPHAIAAKLELLASNHRLLGDLSNRARERSKDFTIAAYGERLLATDFERNTNQAVDESRSSELRIASYTS